MARGFVAALVLALLTAIGGFSLATSEPGPVGECGCCRTPAAQEQEPKLTDCSGCPQHDGQVNGRI